MYAEFSRFEREFWSRTGQVYSEGFGPVTSQTVECMLRQLQLKPGDALLDVACGPGFISAALEGSGVKATGTDISSEMVRLARELVPGSTFEQADAEALPFGDETFDAVSCNFGILHFGNAPAAMSEAFRVLRSGGRYAYAVWDSLDRNEAMALLTRATESYAAKVALPEGPPFFQYADRSMGRQALERAGFVDVKFEAVPISWRIRSAEEFLQYFKGGAARIGEIFRRVDAESFRQIQSSVALALRNYGNPGTYSVPSAAVVFSGRRP